MKPSNNYHWGILYMGSNFPLNMEHPRVPLVIAGKGGAR